MWSEAGRQAMLTLTEWLKQVGFQGRNPFGNKQADDEGDLLQAYFVEHPAYNAMLDFEPPRSSILHAPRGAGKSSSRRMFEDHCAGHAAELRPLLVRMLDWMPLAERAGGLGAIQPHDHIDEIFHRTVHALAQDTRSSWLEPPQHPDMAGYLNWICLSADRYLTPSQRDFLKQRGWVVESDITRLAPYRMEQMGALQRLELLVGVLRAIGYQTCFVLIDRIDELFETAPDWEAGAVMLAPLIANLALNQISGLACKYFIPTEIIEILRARRLLREDRISCSKLSWGGPQGRDLLSKLLRNRLSVFSKDQLPSLAAIAAPDLRDIDDILVTAAQESPRRLLNLGDTLFHACAGTADQNHLLIEQEHLDAALFAHEIRTLSPGIPNVGVKPDSRQSATPPDQAVAGVPTSSPAPPMALLRVEADGQIWRGDQLIDGWQRLPALQRRLLEYLYAHRGILCSKNQLIDHVWDGKENPSDEDSLHKLANRLIKSIEPDPHQPVYIQRIYGGFYRLDNAAPSTSTTTTSGEYP